MVRLGPPGLKVAKTLLSIHNTGDGTIFFHRRPSRKSRGAPPPPAPPPTHPQNRPALTVSYVVGCFGLVWLWGVGWFFFFFFFFLAFWGVVRIFVCGFSSLRSSTTTACADIYVAKRKKKFHRQRSLSKQENGTFRPPDLPPGGGGGGGGGPSSWLAPLKCRRQGWVLRICPQACIVLSAADWVTNSRRPPPPPPPHPPPPPPPHPPHQKRILDLVKRISPVTRLRCLRNSAASNFEEHQPSRLALGQVTQYLGWVCGFFDMDLTAGPRHSHCHGPLPIPNSSSSKTEAVTPAQAAPPPPPVFFFCCNKNLRTAVWRRFRHDAGAASPVPRFAARGKCAFGDFQ